MALEGFLPDASDGGRGGVERASRPATPSRRTSRQRRGPRARGRHGRSAGGRPRQDAGAGDPCRRHRDRARPRPCGDRGDHVVHEHLQPVGDARGGHPGPQRGRAGAHGQAVGQDLARPRLQGRDRVPRSSRADGAARGARLSPRRLRLHHLHRQQRAAARGDLRCRRRRGPGRRLGALGQPQLRGPHQSRREDELPRVAAAVCGLCARGNDGHRPLRRAARRGRRRRARVPEGHLADGRRGRGDGAERGPVGHVPQELRRGVRRRRALELARGADRETASPGTPTRPMSAGPRSSRICPPSPSRSPTSTARECSRCSATASPPTTSRRRARSSATARPAST